MADGSLSPSKRGLSPNRRGTINSKSPNPKGKKGNLIATGGIAA